MTLQEAQQQVDAWIKTYGVRYFSELTNLAVLTEEVGELARVMARRYGDQSFKAGSSAWPTRRASTSPKPSPPTSARRLPATTTDTTTTPSSNAPQNNNKNNKTTPTIWQRKK